MFNLSIILNLVRLTFVNSNLFCSKKDIFLNYIQSKIGKTDVETSIFKILLPL